MLQLRKDNLGIRAAVEHAFQRRQVHEADFDADTPRLPSAERATATIRSDAAPILARRILDEMLEREAGASLAAEDSAAANA